MDEPSEHSAARHYFEHNELQDRAQSDRLEAVGERSSPGPAATVDPQDRSGSRSRRVAASFQLKVDDVVQTSCPRCGHQTSSQGLATSLTLAPIPEGLHVLLVSPGATMRTVVDDVKRSLALEALKEVGGNQSQAAKRLGMKYTTFHALVKRLGIDQPGSL